LQKCTRGAPILLRAKQIWKKVFPVGASAQ
jgi:hypothetical protein